MSFLRQAVQIIQTFHRGSTCVECLLAALSARLTTPLSDFRERSCANAR